MSDARKTTRTARTNRPNHTRVIVKGVVTLALVVALLALAITANSGVPGRDYGKAYISVPEVGSLRVHDKVAIGGVRVGQVVTSEPTSTGARTELQLEPDVRLPVDSQVQIRANGLLGARYVQLIPGSSTRKLADGGTIRSKANVLSAGVPDLLEIFDKDTRGALSTAVTGLGKGVIGNGRPLNDAIRVSSDAVDPFGATVETIADRGDAAEQLLPSLESAMRPLSDERERIGALLLPADIGLRPLVDERTATRDTLVAAPPALDAARDGLTRGQRLLDATGELARAAHATLPSAPAGLRGLTGLLQDARAGDPSPLARTTALLDTAQDAVPAALRITDALRPTLKHVDGFTTPVGPILNTVSASACDIINFAAVARSMTGFGGTGVGPVGPAMQFRLQAVGGAGTLSGVNEVNPTRDAYPAPCTNANPKPYPLVPGTGASTR